MFIRETGDQSLTGLNSSASSSGTLSDRSDKATPGKPFSTSSNLIGPQGTTRVAVNESTNGTTSDTSDDAVEEASVSLSTDMVLRRGDRRLIINSKEKLKKFMADHLNTSLEFLVIKDVGYTDIFYGGKFKYISVYLKKIVLYVEFNYGCESVTKKGGTRAHFITKIYSNQALP